MLSVRFRIMEIYYVVILFPFLSLINPFQYKIIPNTISRIKEQYTIFFYRPIP